MARSIRQQIAELFRNEQHHHITQHVAKINHTNAPVVVKPRPKEDEPQYVGSFKLAK